MRVGKLYLCLAGGLVWNTGLRADGLVSPDNPYVPIVTRNVFGINPPLPVDPNADTEPPPKITPNGIMGVFGHLQVLFKVAIPAKPGQPAKDQSYILSEGQAQDDIEVTKIDEKDGMVTFNNHGTVQELPLVVGTASGPPAPGPGASGPGPKFPMLGPAPGGGNANNGGPITFGNRFGQSGGFGGPKPNISGGNNFNGGMNGGANSGSSFGAATANSGFSSQFGAASTGNGLSGQLGATTTSGGTSSSQLLNNLTPDEVQALVAANHLAAVQAGNPAASLFPPTKFDSEAGIPAPPTPGGSTAR